MVSRIIKTPQLPLIALAVFALLLGACAPASLSAPEAAEMEREAGFAPGAPAPEAPMEEAAAEFSSDLSTVSDIPGQEIERIVIMNADLTLIVSDPSQSMDEIAKLAEEMDGFVVGANKYMQNLENGAQVPRASISIRVPAERLNEALDRIKSESDREPQSENISSQDVTREYIDLQSRLENLESTEAQLTKIMESATKTEDVMLVYEQLVDVREQIEVIKGQINYYENASKLSLISVELIADEAVQPLTIGGWQPEGVAKNAVQALINTLKFLANAAIWILIYIIPVLFVLWLIVFLPLSLLWRAWRRRRNQNKEAEKTQETAE